MKREQLIGAGMGLLLLLPSGRLQGQQEASQLAHRLQQAYQHDNFQQVMATLDPTTRKFLQSQEPEQLIRELDRLRVLGKPGEWTFTIAPAHSFLVFDNTRPGVQLQGRAGWWQFFPTYPTDVIRYQHPRHGEVRVFIRESQQQWQVMVPGRTD